jgi:hypothetical protein
MKSFKLEGTDWNAKEVNTFSSEVEFSQAERLRHIYSGFTTDVRAKLMAKVYNECAKLAPVVIALAPEVKAAIVKPKKKP